MITWTLTCEPQRLPGHSPAHSTTIRWTDYWDSEVRAWSVTAHA